MHKVTVGGQPFTFVGALHYVYLILYTWCYILSWASEGYLCIKLCILSLLLIQSIFKGGFWLYMIFPSCTNLGLPCTNGSFLPNHSYSSLGLLLSLEFYEVLLSFLVQIQHSHLHMRESTGYIPTAKAGLPSLACLCTKWWVTFTVLHVVCKGAAMATEFITDWVSGQRGYRSRAQGVVFTLDESFNFSKLWPLLQPEQLG